MISSAAVQKLKDAGITPLACGGGDKWPIHFYWSYLAMRIAGQEQFNAAKAGEGDGFAAPEFIQAVAEARRTRRDGALPGRLARRHVARDHSRVQRRPRGDDPRLPEPGYAEQPGQQLDRRRRPLAGSHRALPVPGSRRAARVIATDDFGGLNGWVITKAAPPETEDFLKFFTSVETMTTLAEKTGILPTTLGAEVGVTDPTLLDNAEQMGRATWHQNYVDQDLGPNVGRVVNDMSVGVMSGEVSPEDASQQIQDTLSMEM